jgi:rubrerythrin
LGVECPIQILQGAIADEYGAQILYSKVLCAFQKMKDLPETILDKIQEIRDEEEEHAEELRIIVQYLESREEHPEQTYEDGYGFKPTLDETKLLRSLARKS